jgi:hypothetical protein
MIVCGTDGMIIDMGKLKYLEKNLPPLAILLITNPSWNTLILNLGLCS